MLHREGFVQRNTKQPTWRCLCDCGVEKVVTGSSLRGGTTKSCGCLHVDYVTSGVANRTHGLSKTPTHNSWRAMKERCDNPKNSHYHIYGGRGITYDKAWGSFDNFLIDMGSRPEGMTLERINTDGNYSKDNCTWATPAQQIRNSRRNVNLTFDGETMCLKDWATRLKINDVALLYRLKHWPFHVAMTAPSNFTYSSKRYKGMSKMISIHGETNSMVDWARVFGVRSSTFYSWIRRKGIEWIEDKYATIKK